MYDFNCIPGSLWGRYRSKSGFHCCSFPGSVSDPIAVRSRVPFCIPFDSIPGRVPDIIRCQIPYSIPKGTGICFRTHSDCIPGPVPELILNSFELVLDPGPLRDGGFWLRFTSLFPASFSRLTVSPERDYEVALATLWVGRS